MAVFARYQAEGIHCQRNQPPRLHDGTIIGRHGFDFQALYQGKFYAFDAKECAGATWRPDARQIHQEIALSQVVANGGFGFFLVYFVNRRILVKFHCPLAGRTFAPCDGEQTTIDVLGAL